MNKAEQPAHEQLTSFDTLASVDLMQFDLQRFGRINPETRQRVYDDELSSIAEGVDRAAYTTFVLPRQDGQLVYQAHGGPRPYGLMLEDGLQAARNDAARDWRKAFLVEWARRDQLIGRQMNMLRPGQQLTWHNAYPHDVARRHGTEFLKKECGLMPERQMGFIYRARCLADGSVQLESHTVDRSDPDAFAAVEFMAGYDPDVDVEALVRAYDGTLRKKYGGRFYAGRRGAERTENAWAEITRQHDLISYFLDGLERLAAAGLPRAILRTRVEQHTYGVWKAFKNRLQSGDGAPKDTPLDAHAAEALIAREVNQAFQQARAAGDIKAGCGGAIAFGPDGPTDPLATFDAIFGRATAGEPKLDIPEGKPNYKFDKRMYCVVCQAPPSWRERHSASKKMCGPCGICKGCDVKLRAKEKGGAALSAAGV